MSSSRIRAGACAVLALTLSGCAAEREPGDLFGPSEAGILVMFYTDREVTEAFEAGLRGVLQEASGHEEKIQLIPLLSAAPKKKVGE